jgi:hypothetical protein
LSATRPSRINLKRITDNLRIASRKGDRGALTLALDDMRTLAFSPRYWEKYLRLLRNPTARLVDLLVIRRGEEIAFQKGRGPRPAGPAVVRASAAPPRDRGPARRAKPPRRRRDAPAAPRGDGVQASLFD